MLEQDGNDLFNSTIAAAPAAAPPPPIPPRAAPSAQPERPGFLEGRIRATYSGRDGYLSRHLDPEFNAFAFTAMAASAARVRFSVGSQFVHGIELLVSSSSVLAPILVAEAQA